jgi:hypothetical protein
MQKKKSYFLVKFLMAFTLSAAEKAAALSLVAPSVKRTKI